MLLKRARRGLWKGDVCVFHSIFAHLSRNFLRKWRGSDRPGRSSSNPEMARVTKIFVCLLNDGLGCLAGRKPKW